MVFCSQIPAIKSCRAVIPKPVVVEVRKPLAILPSAPPPLAPALLAPALLESHSRSSAIDLHVPSQLGLTKPNQVIPSQLGRTKSNLKLLSGSNLDVSHQKAPKFLLPG